MGGSSLIDAQSTVLLAPSPMSSSPSVTVDPKEHASNIEDVTYRGSVNVVYLNGYFQQHIARIASLIFENDLTMSFDSSDSTISARSS